MQRITQVSSTSPHPSRRKTSIRSARVEAPPLLLAVSPPQPPLPLALSHIVAFYSNLCSALGVELGELSFASQPGGGGRLGSQTGTMAGSVCTAGAALQSAMGTIDRCGRASHIYGSAHPALVLRCGNSPAASIEDGRLAVMHVGCEASKSNGKVSG